MSQIGEPFRIQTNADLMHLRQLVSSIAEALQFGKFAKTRTTTAVLELARNALTYAGGGQVRLSLVDHESRVALRVGIHDNGGGIDDLDAVLGGGAEDVRGLRGVRNIADRLELKTGAEGSRISVTFASSLPVHLMSVSAKDVEDALSALAKLDPVAELTHQNRELLDAIATRDLLMREVHHRTANNLALISSLVKLSASRAEHEETAQTLLDLDSRILAVIRAHEIMQQKPDDEHVSFKDFLRQIASNAEIAFKAQDRRISIEVDGDNPRIVGAAAIDLGLIVNELIMNAFKHAFVNRRDGMIKVAAHSKEDGLTLVVSDDGQGLPENVERPKVSGSLGWQMIRKLSRQYGGAIEIDGTQGFSVSVQFDELTLSSD